MDMVKKTLGSQYEEAEGRKQKETKTTLEDIDEETVASQIHPSEVDFIKKQFSNFSLNEKSSEPHKLHPEEKFYERNYSVPMANPSMDE